MELIYIGFLGVLPEITGVPFLIEGSQIRLRASGIECLYGGRLLGLIAVSRRAVTGPRAVLERTILPRKRGSNFARCQHDGHRKFHRQTTTHHSATLEANVVPEQSARAPLRCQRLSVMRRDSVAGLCE